MHAPHVMCNTPRFDSAHRMHQFFWNWWGAYLCVRVGGIGLVGFLNVAERLLEVAHLLISLSASYQGAMIGRLRVQGLAALIDSILKPASATHRLLSFEVWTSISTDTCMADSAPCFPGLLHDIAFQKLHANCCQG